MKIVVMDGHGVNPGDMSWKPFEEFGEIKVYPRTTQDNVLEHVGDAEIILTNKTAFDAATIAKMPKAKYIGVLATGYNVVDTDAAKRQGITVTNIPAYSTDSVAQMVFAHLLNIANRVDHYARAVRGGSWSECPDFCYWDTPLINLAGKTMGIVGLGNIGSKVAQLAACFGMDVFAYTSKGAAELPQGIQKTTLDGLYGACDIISLHCPLTPDTHKMINAKSLAKMRRGAILINTGRGPLVDEADVADALRSRQLGAYAADVMATEPPAHDNPLIKMENAYITPHIAWATTDARERLMATAIGNLRAFMAGKPVNVVNK